MNCMSLQIACNESSRSLASARGYRDLFKGLLKRAKQEQAQDWIQALPEAIDLERNAVRKLSATHYNLSRRLKRLQREKNQSS